jgi:hypothetical protein
MHLEKLEEQFISSTLLENILLSQQLGILKSIMKCETCTTEMSLVDCVQFCNIYAWRCYKKKVHI